jgi:hypothetical protein
MAFVFSVWLQIQQAAGKHIGRDVGEIMAGTFARRSTGYGFALQTQKRQPLAPLLLALFAERHVHASVAIVVA